VKGRNDRVVSAAYRPEPAAVAAARKFVRQTLQDWLDTGPAPPDTELVDDAVLLTSELVTNAVVHAGTQVQVTCKLAASAVEVVVRDSHPARMVPGPAHDDSIPAERTHGRGLLLPSALASAWGVSYGAEAKAVWFRMGLAGQKTGLAEPVGDPDATESAVPAAGWNVRAASPPAAGQPAAEPSYDDLLRQAVGSARVIVAGDAAYALVADEDGDLSVRAATGISPAALLRTAPSVATVPFIVDGRVTGVLAVAAVLPGRFGDSDLQRLQQLADGMATALERARLAGLERARRARIDVLAEASELLAGPLDADRILALGGQVAVPRLAEWCAVLAAGPDAELRVLAARHADEQQAGALCWLLERARASAPWPRSVAHHGAAHHGAAHHGAAGHGGQHEGRPGGGGQAHPAQRWELAGDGPAGGPAGVVELAARGAWCFPLATPAGVGGLLVLGGPHTGRPSREVLSLAGDLAGRIALALENARLAAEQQAAGQALRAVLLPAELPRVPGVELAVAHDLPGTAAAATAGGDFCDVFPAGPGRWRFAVGEVCGTGPATLTVTSLARNTLRILAGAGLGIPAVLDRLNQLVLDEQTPGTFLTLVHGEITEPGADGAVQLSLACAGQPLPLVLRVPSAGPEPAAAPQPVLGVIDGLSFTAQSARLAAGELLLCVTDGVTRRRDGDRLLDDDDGLARLLAGCGGLTAEVAASKVHGEVRGFGGRPAADGMAVLVLRAGS
jgi:serine phosphatase RsbU (regulator of sigma subunit)/anti-sigma regulatory factor (Ser/Thr protein kinase)